MTGTRAAAVPDSRRAAPAAKHLSTLDNGWVAADAPHAGVNLDH